MTPQEIIRQPHVNATDMCYIIGAYIKERKGVTIKVNQPHDPVRISLMLKMYQIAYDWYLLK